jgi:hypothetical protein
MNCPKCHQILELIDTFLAIGEHNEIEGHSHYYCHHCQEFKTFFGTYLLTKGEWENE